MRRLVPVLILLALLPPGWWVWTHVLPLRQATTFYASRPLLQQPLVRVDVVPMGLPDVRAATCGRCHQAIYAEWSQSTHRHASTHDAQFQAELQKSRTQDGTGAPGDVAWMCVNCHTPVLNQLERLVVSLKDGALGQPVYVDNPLYDAPLAEDAITCATCHVRDGVVVGPFGNTHAPHATRKEPTLSTATVCLRCHQAQAVMETINLGCFFNTGEEWARGPHRETPCQGCHMPLLERKLAEDFDVPTRPTRRHYFGGSRIPKRPQDAVELEAWRPLYPDGLAVDAPVLVTAEKAPQVVAMAGQVCPSADGCRLLLVGWRNANAGHNLPTGDPERYLTLELRAALPDGKTLASTVSRAGQRFEWWPKVKQLEDTRFAPGERREVGLLVPRVELPVTVTVEARSARMTPEAFEHHALEGKAVRDRVVHSSRWVLFPDGTVRGTQPP